MSSRPFPTEDLRHVFELTLPLWSSAAGNTFFITGGTGFFGRWLLETFAHVNDALALEMRATVLTRDPHRFQQLAPHLANRQDIRFEAGDVRTFSCAPQPFTHVIHAAAEPGAISTDAAVVQMANGIVAGTSRVLEYAKVCGSKNFLFTSSGAVYGSQPAELDAMPENFAPSDGFSASNPGYGEAKRVAEQLCIGQARAGAFEPKIARCFGFVGPGMPLDGHFAVGNFIRDALHGRSIAVRGDGRPVRSYLYAADLATWLWTILFKGHSERAYNVGSNRAVTVSEAATVVSSLAKVGVDILNQTTIGISGSRYVPDVSRAHDELGLSETIGLEKGCSKTLKWFEEEQY
jgi:nucleoside-diphosphate-sugar epimerase